MTVSHVGFSPPMPDAATRVHMALCEVGLGHLKPVPMRDPYAPNHDGWSLDLGDDNRDWFIVEQVWRARELTDGARHLCFAHFNSSPSVAAYCTATRPMTLDCTKE